MSDTQIIHSRDGAVAMVKHGPAIYSLGKLGRTSAASKDPTPTVTIKEQNCVPHSGKVAIWGHDNLFPQNVIKDVEFNTIIGPALDFKVRALYSSGLATYRKTGYDDDGEPILKRVDYQPFIDFCKRNNMTRYLIESITDFYYFYNCFPEFVLSKDRKTITHLTSQAAEECRWELQDENGAINNCYINASWDQFQTETSKNTIVVPTFDPYYDPIETIRDGKYFKYIYPLSYPTPGKKYYQLAHWNGIRKSKWLTLSKYIPEFKIAFMENQLSIKYHIKIPDYWWKWKYKNWDKLNQIEQNKLVDEELKTFNDMLKGPAGAGSTFLTTFRFNESTGKEYAGWIIEPLDDKTKDGVLLEDSQEASTHTLFATAVDGSLIGNTPGKGMGAGSGSDKKAAFNIYLALCSSHEDIILEPVRFLHDYNGWDEDIVYKFPRNFLKDDNQKTPADRQPSNGTN